MQSHKNETKQQSKRKQDKVGFNQARLKRVLPQAVSGLQLISRRGQRTTCTYQDYELCVVCSTIQDERWRVFAFVPFFKIVSIICNLRHIFLHFIWENDFKSLLLSIILKLTGLTDVHFQSPKILCLSFHYHEILKAVTNQSTHREDTP